MLPAKQLTSPFPIVMPRDRIVRQQVSRPGNIIHLRVLSHGDHMGEMGYQDVRLQLPGLANFSNAAVAFAAKINAKGFKYGSRVVVQGHEFANEVLGSNLHAAPIVQQR